MITTPPLGKPFRSIKYSTAQIPDEEGKWQAGRRHSYLDPRGDSGFACGIPAYMPPIIEAMDYKERARLHSIEKTKEGVHFIKCSTAAELERQSAAIFRAFAETLKLLSKVEVIQVTFKGIAPEFDASGDSTGRWLAKEENTSYGGSYGTTQELNFAFRRGFKIGESFMLRDKDGQYYHPRSGSSFFSEGRTILLPFSDDLWQQLSSIRDTISKAIVMLHEVFGKSRAAEDVIRALAQTSFATLPAPAEPEVPQIDRGGRIIRRRTK